MTRLLRQQKPFFTISQFSRLSNIFDNAGQVVFGIMVISPFIENKNDFRYFLLGGTTALMSWTVSMWLAKRGGML